ncbi:hypothetical protein AB0M29_38210 [Streptomyces sp. NPDC051976]|uniref:hypothetical protein n=1 Tax=Streptomyces sp. NPDC051976 TaxID=3154947 RepID=UPI00341FB560
MYRSVAMLVAISMIITAGNLRVKSSTKPDKPQGSRAESEPEDEEIRQLRREGLQKKVSAEEARLFARAILKPKAMRERVTESYEANRRTLHQKVSINLRLDDDCRDYAKNQKVTLPLLVPEKGELLDDFRVFDTDGKPVRTMPYREYLATAAAVVHYMLDETPAARQEGSRDQREDSREALWEMERSALRHIMRPRFTLSPQVIEKAKQEMRTKIERLGINNQTKPVLSLIERLTTHYVVLACVDVPDDGQLTVTYERTVIPSQQENTKAAGPRLKRLIGVFLGARPMYVSVPLGNAWSAQSYHLQVAGPEGLYLSHQSIEPDDNSLYAGDGAYATFRRRLGQRYGHFYSRSLAVPEGRGTSPKARFTFYETPPGSDFQATVAAVSTFLLLWIIGFVVSNAHPADDVLGSDAPVLLLAFPGVAASWVGYESQPGLLSRSLSALLSLMGTVAFSITGSALFMLYHGRIHPEIFEHKIPGGLAVLGVDKIWWGGLIVFSLANAMMISYRWIVRSRMYSRLASRPSFGVEGTQT